MIQGYEKHITTVLVSVITAIVVGTGITTLKNTETAARIETKLDYMLSSFNEYKVSQKETLDRFDARLNRIEEVVYKRK